MKTNNVIALKRASEKSEIQTYFKKVLELKQSGKEFPVNFDEVWPLVYSRRDKAISIFKSNFIQGIDYQTKHQKVEQKGSGGHNKIDYFLSVQCLEFFIARKIKAVFEVYRKVFHQAVGNVKKSKYIIAPKHLVPLSEEQKDRMVIVALMNSNPRKNVAQVEHDYYRQKQSMLARQNGEVSYNYTAQEMLTIIESIVDQPIDKHKVINLLKSGRKA